MFYWFIKYLAWPFQKLYFRIEARGLEHLPPSGPAIVVANHASYLDAGVLGAVLPRKVHFVVLARMDSMWRIRWFYRGMETIALSPGAGEHTPIRRCLEKLAAGGVVGIFPEGSRSPDGRLRSPQEGAALLAMKSGAPVVPAAIEGAFEAFPRGRRWPRPRKIRVRLGAPLRCPGSAAGDRKARREALGSFSHTMMAAIASLRREEDPRLAARAGEEIG